MVSDPNGLTPVVEGESPAADAEGCRCVVASYEAAAPLVSAVTRDASQRVMADPALGDFIDLRFVSMGPRPPRTGDRSSAVRLILERLLASEGELGRSYFAIAVADRSATEVELILAECVNDPYLSALPLRLHGIASVDDRRPANELVSVAWIAISPSGAWTRPDLVDELRRYANELLGQFAARQHGLNHGQLKSLRASYEQHVTPKVGGEKSEVPSPASAEMVEPASRPVPAAQLDVLADSPPEPVPAEGAPAGRLPAERVPADAPRPVQPAPVQAPPAVPVRVVPVPAVPVPAVPVPAGPSADTTQDQLSASPAAIPIRPPRQLLRSRRRPETPSGPAVDAEPEAPRITGLAYMLITGGEITDDPKAWQRNRAALLSVDAKLAELSRVAYLVRVLRSDADTLAGDLRKAGQLSRRHVRSQVDDADFAAVLDEIRTLLRRDLTRMKAAAEPCARPTVVLFAADPPIADSVTIEVFSHLAQEASVIWVVPKAAIDLLAADYTEPAHVHVLPVHADVADEIVGLLHPETKSGVVGMVAQDRNE